VSTQPAIDFLATRHAELARPEPAWLTATRNKAMQHVVSSGLPTTRNELWKYTSLRNLQRREYEPSANATIAAASALPKPAGTGLPTLSFVNGVLCEKQLMPGLSARSLATLIKDEPQVLAGRLSALVNYETHPFGALNTAFFADGVIIEVKAGQQFEQPLLLEFVSTKADKPSLICPRVLIVLEENTRLALIERHVGLTDSENFTSAVTEVHLGTGAQLDHYRLQEMSEKDTCMHLLSVHQSADSQLRTHGVDLGGKLVRNDLQTWLCATGAAADLSGLYLAVGSQHIDNHTRIDHNAPHTSSNENYRGVLADRARAVFNGKVLVAPDAQKVDANQSNRNLLLSGKAEVDTKPELEIYANDVKCSHGATVGQLDEEALFYLRSRGLGVRTARALLTFAFVEEILAGFEMTDLRRYIEGLVAKRLPDADRLEKLA